MNIIDGVPGAVSGRGRKGSGGVVWGFADKGTVGRGKLRTVLFVISDSGVPTNTLTSFLVRFV